MNKQMCRVCNNETNVVKTYPSKDGSHLVTTCSHCGAEIKATEKVELNDEQSERCDEIYNAIYEACKVITEDQNLQWNMAYLGEIAEYACEKLLTTGAATAIRFPSVVEDDNYGSQHIEEYYKREDYI